DARIRRHTELSFSHAVLPNRWCSDGGLPATFRSGHLPAICREGRCRPRSPNHAATGESVGPDTNRRAQSSAHNTTSNPENEKRRTLRSRRHQSSAPEFLRAEGSTLLHRHPTLEPILLSLFGLRNSFARYVPSTIRDALQRHISRRSDPCR